MNILSENFSPVLDREQMEDWMETMALRDHAGSLEYGDILHISGASDKWELREIPIDWVTWVATPSPRHHKTWVPPIVLDTGDGGMECLDGKHRLGEAKYRGEKTALCYVGEPFKETKYICAKCGGTSQGPRCSRVVSNQVCGGTCTVQESLGESILDEADIAPSVDLDGINAEIEVLTAKYRATLNTNIYLSPKAVRDYPATLVLQTLNARRDAPRGTGTAFMTDLCALADRHGLMITLEAGEQRGSTGFKNTTSINRLRAFYARFGFQRNSGKRNYRPDLSGTMHRNARKLGEDYQIPNGCQWGLGIVHGDSRVSFWPCSEGQFFGIEHEQARERGYITFTQGDAKWRYKMGYIAWTSYPNPEEKIAVEDFCLKHGLEVKGHTTYVDNYDMATQKAAADSARYRRTFDQRRGVPSYAGKSEALEEFMERNFWLGPGGQWTGPWPSHQNGAEKILKRIFTSLGDAYDVMHAAGWARIVLMPGSPGTLAVSNGETGTLGRKPLTTAQLRELRDQATERGLELYDVTTHRVIEARERHIILGTYAESVRMVAYDALPRETQEDIAGWIAERAEIQALKDYALDNWGSHAPGVSFQPFDLHDVHAQLHGLVDPIMFAVRDLPVAAITDFRRNPDARIYAGKFQRGEVPPPILVNGTKFVDGGPRLAAALAAGTATIPTVDMWPLLRQDWAAWLRDETNTIHPIKGGMYERPEAREARLKSFEAELGLKYGLTKSYLTSPDPVPFDKEKLTVVERHKWQKLQTKAGMGQKLPKGNGEFHKLVEMAWPADFPSVILHTNVITMKSHVDYAAAKAGDIRAAKRVVETLAKPDKLRNIVHQHPDAVFLPVLAMEASGKNMLPLALARKLSRATGLGVETDIIQINKTFHTNSSGAHRLASIARFDGQAAQPTSYVLVDDVVTSGGTLAAMRQHVEESGGRVVAITALAAAAYANVVAITAGTLQRLYAKFPGAELDTLLKDLKIAPDRTDLTNSQANYVLKFSTVDALRRALEKA